MGQGRGKAPRDPAQGSGHLDSGPTIQLSCGVTLTFLLPLWTYFFSAEGDPQERFLQKDAPGRRLRSHPVNGLRSEKRPVAPSTPPPAPQPLSSQTLKVISGGRRLHHSPTGPLAGFGGKAPGKCPYTGSGGGGRLRGELARFVSLPVFRSVMGFGLCASKTVGGTSAAKAPAAPQGAQHTAVFLTMYYED